MNGSQTNSGERHVPELDGLRGAAILMVIVHHYVVSQISAETTNGTLSILRKLGASLWSGVDLFFVLSGFLITSICIRHEVSSFFFKTFYLRRACRILPPYLVLLAAYIILMGIGMGNDLRFAWLFENPLPLTGYLTFTQNIWMGIRDGWGGHFLAVTWSLAVEEQFYLFLPLLIWWISRKNLPLTFAGLIILAGLLRIAVPGFIGFVNTPWRMDSLLTGSLIAWIWDRPECRAWLQQRATGLQLLLLPLLAGTVLMGTSKHFGKLNHSWLAVFYGALLVCLLVRSHVSVLFRNKALIFFGSISYGLYLYHQAIAGLLHGFTLGTSPSIETPAGAMITALALVLSVGVSFASFRLMEKPIIALGKRHAPSYSSPPST